MSENIMLPAKSSISKENPFNGDLFNRRELANRLTQYINLLKNGFVMGVDAPWGEGKTWFGQNWCNDLESQNYKVLYIDAFKNDYIEDPFLLIASEIQSLIVGDKSNLDEFKDKTASVARAIMPLASKILINAMVKNTLGISNATEAISQTVSDASEAVADETKEWIEQSISSFQKDKNTLSSFVTALADFCKSQDKPVVIFVDELDRCKPTFSVKLIERIKHLFDVPNLVFILLTNRSQIEASIKGVYGSDTDAGEYIGKFVHLFLKLPKLADVEMPDKNANRKYLVHLASYYKIDLSKEHYDGFINAFSVISCLMNMSLREIEQGMTVFMFNSAEKDLYPYLAWPIVLKIKYPRIFYNIHSNSHTSYIESHESAIKILDKVYPSTADYPYSVLHFFKLIHQKALGRTSEDEEHYIKSYGPRTLFSYSQNDSFIKHVIASIDISFSKNIRLI